MKVSLTPSLLAALPGMSVHGMVARAIDLDAVAGLSCELPVPGETEGDALIARWKQLYKSLPCDKRARSSIEYLIKAARKQKLRPILPLVDLYNAASLRCFSPFGGENLHTMQGSLQLDCAQGNEVFVPLGKELEELALPGEVIWVDGARRVVCRAMNWLESDLHKLNGEVRDVIFVSERPDADYPSPQDGFDYLEAALAPHCASLQRFVLDAGSPSIDIAL